MYTNDSIHAFAFVILTILFMIQETFIKLTDTSWQPWSAAVVLAVIQQRAFGENVQLHSSS